MSQGVNWYLNPQCSPCISTQLYPYINWRCVYWNLNMKYYPTRWYGAATPIIRGLLLNDAKVGCNKDMLATIHTGIASFHINGLVRTCHNTILKFHELYQLNVLTINRSTS